MSNAFVQVKVNGNSCPGDARDCAKSITDNFKTQPIKRHAFKKDTKQHKQFLVILCNINKD